MAKEEMFMSGREDSRSNFIKQGNTGLKSSSFSSLGSHSVPWLG